jgi:hypothetical protein
MNLHRYAGGCHCGNIRLEFVSTRSPGEFRPRACDCSFCRKHGAAYVSDPRGKLSVTIGDRRELSTYRQGSGSAELLICGKCGVLPLVVFAEADRRYATVNANAIDNSEAFGEAVVVSPQKLGADEKRARWKELWFADVSFA